MNDPVVSVDVENAHDVDNSGRSDQIVRVATRNSSNLTSSLTSYLVFNEGGFVTNAGSIQSMVANGSAMQYAGFLRAGRVNNDNFFDLTLMPEASQSSNSSDEIFLGKTRSSFNAFPPTLFLHRGILQTQAWPNPN